MTNHPRRLQIAKPGASTIISATLRAGKIVVARSGVEIDLNVHEAVLLVQQLGEAVGALWAEDDRAGTPA